MGDVKWWSRSKLALLECFQLFGTLDLHEIAFSKLLEGQVEAGPDHVCNENLEGNWRQ